MGLGCVQGKTVRAAAFAACAALLAACTPTLTADQIELNNLDPRNAVPKSSPTQLITALRQYCLEPTPEEATVAKLRSAGYVEKPTSAGAPRLFLVDDRRPAVVLSEQAGICLVGFEARTGQTEALRRFAAEIYGTEKGISMNEGRIEAWAKDDEPIFLIRRAELSSQAYAGFLRGSRPGRG